MPLIARSEHPGRAVSSVRLVGAARPLALGLGALGAAGAAAAVWGIGIERHLYTLRQVSVAALPEGAAPLRILHLSDAHLAPWQHRRARFIASLAAWGPDLVIDTGDNVGHPDALPALRRALSPFAGVPGVFVYGSNDKFAPEPRNPLAYLQGASRTARDAVALDVSAMASFFTDDLGWVDLNNTAVRMRVAGQVIDFFGVDDAHRGWDDLDAATIRLRRLGRRAAMRIGVTHAPYARVLDRFVEAGADAVFAGHTHGGQVCLPGVGALTANCDIPLKQAKGLSTWSAAGRTVPLHVSAGLGHSIFAPVRFACRPEATLLTLTARPTDR